MNIATSNKLRYSFRHGENRQDLDKLVALFKVDGYLSPYLYEQVTTDGDTTVFDVVYNPEAHSHLDVKTELNLGFRSLNLYVN